MSAGPSLLSGPPLEAGMEHLDAHLARLGALPPGNAHALETLERSGLLGRGGAAFPVATKWRSVAQRARGDAAILANGAEGEPLSHKDRLLMERRPHLVLDGVALAAQTVGARDAVLYVGAAHGAAVAAMREALAERPRAERRMTRLVASPARYVAGEESAAVHFVEAGVALPTATPPRVYERGIGGRPTLVQNVETLAHTALIARYGDAWFRGLGAGTSSGTALLTVSGAVQRRGVVEVPMGSTVGEAIARAGGASDPGDAVLLGGYFGGWVSSEQAWEAPVDAAWLRSQGMALGSGVIAVLPAGRCGVEETARIVAYLADQSARQCGPCVFGLRAIAEAVDRLAHNAARDGDLQRVQRWSGQLAGRGACRHPDGAAVLVGSALRTFDVDFARHAARRGCEARPAQARQGVA
ncbi:MAG TPA: NADH-ubiquinone oxidoreductase-F iron-sulfur binding region domain-containing protein [Candidatus Dormibacteraeota bacterium]|jgi:NADH:ubiquinone oxidoreductase subunit F (NADH-binding)|nr:NADH-ubiquinone oxidoreductase-F iron-sulfur binding region domain-containing protein [Candidatus Dormibacteraeota bacterium]